jgi:hypothetical protein
MASTDFEHAWICHALPRAVHSQVVRCSCSVTENRRTQHFHVTLCESLNLKVFTFDCENTEHFKHPTQQRLGCRSRNRSNKICRCLSDILLFSLSEPLIEASTNVAKRCKARGKQEHAHSGRVLLCSKRERSYACSSETICKLSGFIFNRRKAAGALCACSLHAMVFDLNFLSRPASHYR